MSELQISLNEKNNRIIWSLPESDFVLTLEDPGPKPIETSNISIGQLKVIAMSHIKGDLLVEPLDALRAALKQNTPSQVDTPVKSVQIEPQKVSEGVSDKVTAEAAKEKINRVVELKKLVCGTLKALKVQLKDKSLHDLKIMLQLEKDNKNRKTALNLINEELLKKHSEMHGTILKDLNPDSKSVRGIGAVYSGLQGVNMNNISPVVEEEVETVVFTPSKEDEEDTA